MPISTGVCGDPCGAAPITVAVVCGDQYNAVLISVMCGRLGRSPCITMTMVVNQMWSARPERVPIIWGHILFQIRVLDRLTGIL